MPSAGCAGRRFSKIWEIIKSIKPSWRQRTLTIEVIGDFPETGDCLEADDKFNTVIKRESGNHSII